MIPFGKLAKFATGSFGPDDLPELAASFGIEYRFEEVPGDKKPAAFQEVAQFSMLEGAEIMRATMLTKDGSRVEVIAVVRASDQSNPRNLKKIIDSAKADTISLCEST